MRSHINTLFEQVSSYKPSHISLTSPDTEISSIAKITPDNPCSDDNVLYIGYASRISGVFPRNAILLEDVPIEGQHLKSRNIALLPADMDADGIYTVLINHIMKAECSVKNAEDLLLALSKARGLQTIVDIGYKMLENPLIVSDKSWKALALTAQVNIPDDRGWNEFINEGALSLNTVSMDIKNNLTDKIEQSERPFVLKEASMKYPRMFGKVMIGSRPVATVSVIEYNRPFIERDYQLLALLCNAVSAEMQKNKFLHYTRGLLYEKFIEDLLEGRIKNTGVIEAQIKTLNLEIKDYIFVLAIDIRRFDSKHFSVSYMRDYLEKMISGSKALIYNDNITIVASYPRKNMIFELDAINLKSFLKQYNIRCGLSRCFTDLTQLRDFYNQAMQALELGYHMDSDKYFYSYDDYAIYHIAKACSASAELKVFCHPKLLYLMKYDREHKTSFTDSLYAYLKLSRNITNTAKALNLHRNSLIYHLKRIQEILETDINNNETLLHIELSFRLLEYERKIERKEYGKAVSHPPDR